MICDICDEEMGDMFCKVCCDTPHTIQCEVPNLMWGGDPRNEMIDGETDVYYCVCVNCCPGHPR